ncbi:hypothetical protein KQ939_15730 [Planococcus sp. CP5-4]|nr:MULTISPECIES: hypothetical protein [unclassified Planococcus (in: firmicutes)]MBU9674535.1 hypothetical protein [Planococcus sp. CP5-4_YE]MBV0910275.1 hypothetical protein [Planococcus sp. CP5-4_UN]MBW6065126.1 hypothetical protein [Planococcus sp. CP5-4]
MEKKKLLVGATLALILALSAGLPQFSTQVENANGNVTINGPQVLPPV